MVDRNYHVLLLHNICGGKPSKKNFSWRYSNFFISALQSTNERLLLILDFFFFGKEV